MDQVYPIRTLYRQKIDTNMEFTSFTSNHKDSRLDITSTESRIQSADAAQKLFLFAPIIDREAWALASVSKRFKKDFFCYKYISDNATQEACTQVKEIAHKISKALLETYCKNTVDVKTTASLDTPNGYHFTFTQNVEFEKLVRKLSLQKNISSQEVLTSLPDCTAVKPKDRTKQLLKHLSEQLDPFTFKVREKLHQMIAPYQTESIKLKFDPTLESDELEITLKCNNPAELQTKIDMLKTFPYSSMQELLRGQDVE